MNGRRDPDTIEIANGKTPTPIRRNQMPTPNRKHPATMHTAGHGPTPRRLASLAALSLGAATSMIAVIAMVLGTMLTLLVGALWVVAQLLEQPGVRFG
jgi:hypothetical protein